jgi:hypothetical protein
MTTTTAPAVGTPVQFSDHRGVHNGTVIRVNPNGKTVLIEYRVGTIPWTIFKNAAELVPASTTVETAIGPVLVSTVEVPGGFYETAVFWGGGSETVDRYGSAASAIAGHGAWLDPARLEGVVA